MEEVSNSQVVDNKIIRVVDILEQVEELNKMIELHKSNDNNSMLVQYQFMKREFIQELETLLLGQFQIKIQAA